MSKHRKDYVDVHRTTEQERDSIEQEVILHVLISDIIVFFRLINKIVDFLFSVFSERMNCLKINKFRCDLF